MHAAVEFPSDEYRDVNCVSTIDSEAENSKHSQSQQEVALEEGLLHGCHKENNKNINNSMSCHSSPLPRRTTSRKCNARTTTVSSQTSTSSMTTTVLQCTGDDSRLLYSPATPSATSALTPRRCSSASSSSIRISVPASARMATATTKTTPQPSCSSVPSSLMTASQAPSSSSQSSPVRHRRWSLWMMRFMVIFVDVIVFVVFEDSLAINTNHQTSVMAQAGQEQHPPTLTLIHHHATSTNLPQNTPNIILMNNHFNNNNHNHNSNNMHMLSHARSLASPEFRLLEKMIMEEEQSKNHSLFSSSSTNSWWMMTVLAILILVGMAIELWWKKLHPSKRRR